MAKKQVKLGFSIWPTGRHASGWRLPGANTGGSVDPDHLRWAAQTVERAKFDYFFIGNQLVSDPAAQTSTHIGVFKVDAFSLASFVAASTQNIGIVATVNANYIDPYATARSAATLDHLSKGRAGINFITSTGSNAGNFSKPDDFTHDYGRTAELVDVIRELWDSWEDDAVVGDKEAGIWVDPAKAHEIAHRGAHFAVRGPLNIPRPPQGQLPIVHAGASEDSKEFGAQYADIRFSPYVDTAWNKAYYADVKARLAQYGRSPEEQFVLPGVTFYAAETSREAHDLFRRVQELQVVPYAPGELTARLGADVSGVPEDTRIVDAIDIESLPQVLDLGGAGIFGFADKTRLLRLAFRAYGTEDVTLRQLFDFLQNGPYPQSPVVGSATQIADWFEEQLDEEATDGAVVFPPFLPGPLEAFTKLVVPELQRRGRFRTEYQTRTLREHFGLPAKPNRFATAPAAVAS